MREVYIRCAPLRDQIAKPLSATRRCLLKFLNDLELQREGEAKLAAKKFTPAIEPPYRWRDWAAQSDEITGEEQRGKSEC